MRKITSFLMAVFCLIGSSVWAQDGERLSFGVISDIHFENNVGEGAMVKVPKALKNLTSHAKLDALAVVGDLTNNGRADEYEMLTSVFQDQANFTNPVGQLFFMLGNHDNFDSKGKSNYQEGLKAFNGGEPYPYHIYQVIKGYPFITLSEFSGDSQDTSSPANGTNAYPADNQKLLAGYLEKAAAECPGKPIFIFTHVPPRWTVYGSWPELESGNTWAMKVLNPILNKYPQAVVFAGHSHYPLGDPRSIHQGANPESARENFYTVINTSSTTYGEVNPGAVSDGIHPKGYEYVTEGMIVTELENGDIEICRYDTYRNQEIGAQQRWVLKAPFDGSQFQYADIRDKDDNPGGLTLRDGLPAPVWGDGASLSVEADGYRGSLTFPQATDNECVFRYRVRIFRDGMVFSEKFVFSQFYLNADMPNMLSHNINGLSPNTEYSVEVVAMDSYDNQSAPLKTTFRTPDVAVDLLASADGFWTFSDPSDLLKAEGGDMSLQPVAALNSGVSLYESLEEGGYTAATGAAEGDGAIFLPKAAGMRVNRIPGSSLTREWTVMWYMMLPNAAPYNCPFQTNKDNSNDGDLFIKGNQIGMGAMGGYFGQINNETWHRIVLTNRGGDCYVFVDGQQIINFKSEGRWEIDSWGFYIFVDEDGEMSDTYLSEFGFWERGLTTDEIRSLSGLEPLGDSPQDNIFNVITQSIKIVDQLEFSITVNATVPVTFELPDWIEAVDVTPFLGQHAYLFRAEPMDYSGSREDVIIVKAEGKDDQEVRVEQIFIDEGAVPEALGWWTFDNKSNPMENKGATSILVPAHRGSDGRPEATDDLASADIKYVAGPTDDNLALSVPKDSYLWLTHNTGSESLNTYTILYDVMLNDVNGYKAMLQNDVTNTKDAAIFFKNNQLGRGSIGYNGNFLPEIWYRVLFVIKEGCASIYINGQKLTESNTPYDYMVMGPGALLFADEDGEAGLVNVASVRFWDMALSEDMIARLGDSYSDLEELLVVKTPNVRVIDKTDFSITVNANVPFTFDLPDWIEPIDVECVEGEKDYLFRAQPLEEEGRRTGIITVESDYFSPIEVPVTQILLGDKMPEPYTVWTFDNPSDLLAGDGPATLQAAFKGENGPEVINNLGLSEINAAEGPVQGNGAIGVPKDSYLWLTNNMGLSELKDYALLMDIRPSSLNEQSALYQKNTDNTTDAGLFINKGMVGINASGLGYRGSMTYMKWHRILFVVRDGYASTYIDGRKVGESTSPNGAWTMLPEVLLFADNDGQESHIELAELRLWDVPISDDNVRELGAIEQGWEEEPFIEVTSRWTFDNPDDLMAGTGSATMRPSVHSEGVPHAVDTPADAGIVAIAGPSDDNRAITVPYGSSLQLAHNEEDGTLNSFTLLMDVRFNILTGYNVFFQADMNNSADAGLFADGTEIGRNINGLGYGGRLYEGQWHRVVARAEYNVLSCFIDGVKVLQATSANNGSWVMHELFYLFCDNDGEEKDVDVAEICFWDDCISAEQISALGGVGTPTGIDKIQGTQKSRKVQEGIYNLKGQRLSTPQHGLNIIDGKLILVK